MTLTASLPHVTEVTVLCPDGLKRALGEEVLTLLELVMSETPANQSAPEHTLAEALITMKVGMTFATDWTHAHEEDECQCYLPDNSTEVNMAITVSKDGGENEILGLPKQGQKALAALSKVGQAHPDLVRFATDSEVNDFIMEALLTLRAAKKREEALRPYLRGEK